MTPGLARRLATGANALLVSGFFVAIVGTVVDLSVRHSVLWDLSADSSSTLLPETKALLDRIAERQATFQVTAYSNGRTSTVMFTWSPTATSTPLLIG